MSASAGPSRTSWPAVGIAIFTGMVAAAAIGKVPPALPAVREQLGLTMVEAGWVVSTFSTLGTCCALFFGGASDRLGQLRFALLGLGVMIVGALIGAAAHGYVALLVSRVLEGSGFIAVAVAIPSLITRSTAPGDYRLALGLWSTYLPFGSSVTMLAAPLMLPALGWRGVWVLIAAATAACAALLYGQRHRYGPTTPQRHAARGVIGETLRRPGAWCLSAAFLTYTLQWFTLMVWLPSFLVENRGLSTLAAGALTAAVVAANIPGNVLGGWLVHRHVRRGVLLCATSAFMLVCAFGIFDERVPDALRYGLCLMFTCVGGILPAAAFSGMATHAPSPRHIGAVNGLIVQGSNLGQLLGPPAIAAAVTATGSWQAATSIMAAGAMAGIASGVVLMWVERERRASVEPAAPTLRTDERS